jgi:hypothetical protein
MSHDYDVDLRISSPDPRRAFLLRKGAFVEACLIEYWQQ